MQVVVVDEATRYDQTIGEQELPRADGRRVPVSVKVDEEGWLHAPEHLRRQPGEALIVEARNEVRAIPRVADDPT